MKTLLIFSCLHWKRRDESQQIHKHSVPLSIGRSTVINKSVRECAHARHKRPAKVATNRPWAHNTSAYFVHAFSGPPSDSIGMCFLGSRAGQRRRIFPLDVFPDKKDASVPSDSVYWFRKKDSHGSLRFSATFIFWILVQKNICASAHHQEKTIQMHSLCSSDLLKSVVYQRFSLRWAID